MDTFERSGMKTSDIAHRSQNIGQVADGAMSQKKDTSTPWPIIKTTRTRRAAGFPFWRGRIRPLMIQSQNTNRHCSPLTKYRAGSRRGSVDPKTIATTTKDWIIRCISRGQIDGPGSKSTKKEKTNLRAAGQTKNRRNKLTSPLV